jgi:hypothetical protein
MFNDDDGDVDYATDDNGVDNDDELDDVMFTY